MNISKSEKISLIYKEFGIRLSSSIEEYLLDEILSFKLLPKYITPAKFDYNSMRITIINYIKEFKDQLALPCDGNCFNHSDAMVTNCFIELVRENHGQSKKEANTGVN